LMFEQERKNRRISKIKSKKFHKIQKKNREKDEQRILSQLGAADPEALKKYNEEQEKIKINERLRMRHSTSSKYAKNLKRFTHLESEEVKNSYKEYINQRDQLKIKFNESDEESESEDSPDQDENNEESNKSEEEHAAATKEQEEEKINEGDVVPVGRFGKAQLEQKRSIIEELNDEKPQLDNDLLAELNQPIDIVLY
jgi:U3 small nucleolar RNA-associated protein 14